MKLQKTDYDGEPIDFEQRPPHEQRLLMLIGGVAGKYKTDYMGMERPLSIRLNCKTYPMVKALSNLSTNSMNLVINDLIEVAYGVMLENMAEEEAKVLIAEQNKINDEWIAEYQVKEDK